MSMSLRLCEVCSKGAHSVHGSWDGVQVVGTPLYAFVSSEWGVSVSVGGRFFTREALWDVVRVTSELEKVSSHSKKCLRELLHLMDEYPSAVVEFLSF